MRGTFLLLVFAISIGSCVQDGGRFDRVVLIVIDTLRRDHVGTYGGDAAETPAIDALARRGVAHPNAIASFHQTTMSIAALFTGRLPALEWAPETIPDFAFNSATWCGLRRLGERGDSCLPSSVATLAEQMKLGGFETLGVASNPFLHSPSGYERGFDTWIEVNPLQGRRLPFEELAAARNANAVVRGVMEALEQRSSDRFFLYAHFMDAHDWRGSTYAAGVEASDAGVAALLALLEEQDLMRKTLVVLTADHGEMFPSDEVLIPQKEHRGNPSFDPVVEVPLVFAPAIELPDAGLVRSDQLGSLLLELVGITPDESWPRVSLLEADETFTSETRWRSYRQDRWKSVWMRDGSGGHLFDLEQGEHVDVLDQHPKIADRHRARIDAILSSLRSQRTRPPDELQPGDLELLRALGYAD